MPISQPQLFARFTVMRDERSMIEMLLGMSVFVFLIITPTIAIGMYGAINYPDLSAGEFWVNTLVNDQPEIIGALAVVGLLAAAMSLPTHSYLHWNQRLALPFRHILSASFQS